jgi:hypothetical protein
MAIRLANRRKSGSLAQDSHSVQSFGQSSFQDIYDLNGVIKFRGRDQRRVPVPSSVRRVEPIHTDMYGNPLFPFTGRGTFLLTIPTGSWETYQMRFGRGRYAGGKLLDGRIIVAGGRGTSVALSGSETFSSASNTWSVLKDMPAAKDKTAGVVLPLAHGGDFLVVGGSGSATTGVVTYRYATGSGNWSTVASTIVNRHYHQLALLTDGRVFAAGGTGLISGTMPFTGSEVFHPGTNEWTGTLPIPLEPYDRYGYALTVLDDGSVLMTGGRDASFTNYSHAFRYYPSSSTTPASWSIEPSMTLARSDHRAVKLGDGRVLVAGGGIFTRTAAGGGDATPFVYSFVMPFIETTGGATAIHDVHTLSYDDVEIYDPSTGRWTVLGQMKKDRSSFMMIALQSSSRQGRVFACGGEDVLNVISSSEGYDVEANHWAETQRMPIGVKDALIFALGDGISSPYSLMVPGGIMTGTTPYTGSQVFQTTA